MSACEVKCLLYLESRVVYNILCYLGYIQQNRHQAAFSNKIMFRLQHWILLMDHARPYRLWANFERSSVKTEVKFSILILIQNKIQETLNNWRHTGPETKLSKSKSICLYGRLRWDMKLETWEGNFFAALKINSTRTGCQIVGSSTNLLSWYKLEIYTSNFLISEWST